MLRHTSSVLLVEDDEDHTALMRRALDRARVANPLVVAKDREVARDYLFGIGPHAGRDVRDAPDLDEDLVRAYGLGANSFVRKPVDFDAFQRAVERIALYWLVVNQPPPLIERDVA